MVVKRGDLVEYTDHYVQHFDQDTPGIKYGVAIKTVTALDLHREGVPVMRADGKVETANFVHSFGWAGWVPDGLEPILERFNREEAS